MNRVDVGCVFRTALCPTGSGKETRRWFPRTVVDAAVLFSLITRYSLAIADCDRIGSRLLRASRHGATNALPRSSNETSAVPLVRLVMQDPGQSHPCSRFYGESSRDSRPVLMTPGNCAIAVEERAAKAARAKDKVRAPPPPTSNWALSPATCFGDRTSADSSKNSKPRKRPARQVPASPETAPRRRQRHPGPSSLRPLRCPLHRRHLQTLQPLD